MVVNLSVLFIWLSVVLPVSAQQTEVLFKQTTLNLGTINLNDTVYSVFEFKNTGKVPFIITNITTTCGCTVAEKNELPVNPKSKGEITIRFVASDVGAFTRTISVFANLKLSPQLLTISGRVLNSTK